MLARAVKFLDTSEFGGSRLYSETKVLSQAPPMPVNQSACREASGWLRITLCLFRVRTCEMGEQEPNWQLTTPALHMNPKHCSLANTHSFTGLQRIDRGGSSLSFRKTKVIMKKFFSTV